MTTTELSITDADKRFVLGPALGWTPTAESISDTDVTPFGLTLRTAPHRMDNNATQAVTEVTSDGNETDADVSFDVTDD